MSKLTFGVKNPRIYTTEQRRSYLANRNETKRRTQKRFNAIPWDKTATHQSRRSA